MRNSGLLLIPFAVLGLLVGIAIAADTPATVPKEGSGSGTAVYSGTVKALSLGKDRAQVTYEVVGISLDDKGEGLLHRASVHCVGGLHVVNGSFDNESGSCVYTRLDGDQAFYVYKGAGKMGVEIKGTGTFVGGTGKLAGLQGTAEWTRWGVRPATEGITQSHSRWTSTYKLP